MSQLHLHSPLLLPDPALLALPDGLLLALVWPSAPAPPAAAAAADGNPQEEGAPITDMAMIKASKFTQHTPQRAELSRQRELGGRTLVTG